MSAVFHQIIHRLREALSELYEAAYAAQEWLEEGPGFRPAVFAFHPQPQPQKS